MIEKKYKLMQLYDGIVKVNNEEKREIIAVEDNKLELLLQNITIEIKNRVIPSYIEKRSRLGKLLPPYLKNIDLELTREELISFLYHYLQSYPIVSKNNLENPVRKVLVYYSVRNWNSNGTTFDLPIMEELASADRYKEICSDEVMAFQFIKYSKVILHNGEVAKSQAVKSGPIYYFDFIPEVLEEENCLCLERKFQWKE